MIIPWFTVFTVATIILSWAMWSLFIYNGAQPHLVRLFLGNTPKLCPYLNHCKTWGASVCHSRRQEWDCPNYWSFEWRRTRS